LVISFSTSLTFFFQTRKIFLNLKGFLEVGDEIMTNCGLSGNAERGETGKFGAWICVEQILS
jgi:hypothetical protein